MTAVNHLTRAQREDVLTELRELLPDLRSKAAGHHAAADFNDTNPTAFETDLMADSRADIVAAYRALADATTRYRTHIARAVEYLEGQ